jgi:DNA-binding HxlR family transcriptional regulator
MLGRIGGLFRHRWDPHVITALAGQPLRYRALSISLAAQTGEHLDDSTLTRSLHRLIRDGLVTADAQLIAGRDINLYQLTCQGRDHLTAYRSFLAAYEQLTTTGGHSVNGIWPHHPHSA